MDAVAWQHPEQGSSGYLGSYRSGPPPRVGVTVSGGRAFATMFSMSNRNRYQRVGRRRDSFYGPSVLKAIDLASGKLLWDTDILHVQHEGEPRPLIDTLPFSRKNFFV